jgi:hypothetical protein
MSKRKGTRVEHKVIELLEAVGFKCVRSTGSFGPFDIVAIQWHLVRLIQVKSNRKPGPDEIEEMRAWRVSPDILKEYCVWKDREKYPVFYSEWEW